MNAQNRLTSLLGIEIPVIQAPMAGANGSALAIAVSEAGGLGSQPCAMLSIDQARAEIMVILRCTENPFNVNFFCHVPPIENTERERHWRAALDGYYGEFGLAEAPPPGALRQPFGEAHCAMVEELKPPVVSFHFGLPEASLVARVKAAGAKVLSSATTVAEAKWLAERGCDAIIAQGAEAGGHRGIFLSDAISSQPGTMALVPQVVDAVALPVIAAGGIADARGAAAAFALGASGVQIGTAYLLSDEATTSPVHRNALAVARDDATALTNVFTGRFARGLMNRLMREQGPASPHAPAFPLAANAVQLLRVAAETRSSGDFSPLWSGQAGALAKKGPAGAFTRRVFEETQSLLKALKL